MGTPPASNRRRQDLVETASEFTAAFSRWVESTATDGLTYPRLRILEHLGCHGPGKMKEVADQVGISARNITALVDTMEADGLVVRKPHPTDRRAVLLELTDTGRNSANTCFVGRIDAIGEVFDGLTATEQRELTRLLVKARDGINKRR